jgi:hypothetical protein
MKFITTLPFVSVMEDQRLEVAIWRTEPGDPSCEYDHDQVGACDPSGISDGTDDPNAPRFCARHFYQRAVAGDGVDSYTLVDEPGDETHAERADN